MMNKLKVWYDGGCPLCRREIALMSRLDRKDQIEFINLDDPTSFCPVDRQEALERFHALESGRMVHGAEAFAAMWRAVPLLRPLGLLARVRPVLWVLEIGYGLFLRLRPMLQRVALKLDGNLR